METLTNSLEETMLRMDIKGNVLRNGKRRATWDLHDVSKENHVISIDWIFGDHTIESMRIWGPCSEEKSSCH